jgi:hypothetical protein
VGRKSPLRGAKEGESERARETEKERARAQTSPGLPPLELSLAAQPTEPTERTRSLSGMAGARNRDPEREGAGVAPTLEAPREQEAGEEEVTEGRRGSPGGKRLAGQGRQVRGEWAEEDVWSGGGGRGALSPPELAAAGRGREGERGRDWEREGRIGPWQGPIGSETVFADTGGGGAPDLILQEYFRKAQVDLPCPYSYLVLADTGPGTTLFLLHIGDGVSYKYRPCVCV